MPKTEPERIGQALYMLAAGADPSVLLETLRAYVVVHSKADHEVLDLLHEPRAANPAAFADAIAFLATDPPANIAQTPAPTVASKRAAKQPTADTQPRKLRKRAKRAEVMLRRPATLVRVVRRAKDSD